MKVLFFGDIFGKPGRQIVQRHLEPLKAKYEIDFVVANCENIADGRGVTEKTLTPLFKAGIDAFTAGNHLWDRSLSTEYIATEERIAAPLNYPLAAVGYRNCILTKNGLQLEIITLIGQVYMPPGNSPFEAFEGFYEKRDKSIPLLIDFHGESTAEKRAFGWFADGRAAAVLGTHTHIQTADEEVLPFGTAYITDVGMTGGHDSVIGVKKEIILSKMTTLVPQRYETSDQGLQINAVVLKIDPQSTKAEEIERIKISVEV